MRNRIFPAFVLLFMLMPTLASACACGCGVFDVSTASMLPTGPGGTVWFGFDFMNQDINWSGSKAAPQSANDDTRLRSDFYTAGMQYMFNRDWGAEIEVPYTERYFRTDGGADSFDHGALGDIRVQGIYSGFSPDMSTGITFGAKLPTGDYSYPGFDRDTDIGSGSTDLLLGAYHLGKFPGAVSPKWSWFGNVLWDQPILTAGQYRPGMEIDAAGGVYYDVGPVLNTGDLSPLLQLIVSDRNRDSGANANPPDTGYTRLLVSPGLEYRIGQAHFYGDVEVPVWQNFNGDQLSAGILYKVILAYDF